MSTWIATIRVCDDCMFVHANGENSNDSHDCAPWSQMPDADVTPDYCPDHTGADCECEQDYADDDGFESFSGCQCDGCGTHLAGGRYRFRVWSW